MWPLFLLTASQLIFKLCTAQNCVYTDSVNGNKLYLDALEHSTLQYTSDHTYTYTPCRNAAGECPNSEGSSGLHTAMCAQTLENDKTVCTVIADMDTTVQPSFTMNPPQNNGTWMFQFNNGDSKDCPGDNPRIFNVALHCDLNAGDYQIITAGEQFEKCEYKYEINTKWACPGENYTTTTTSSPLGECVWKSLDGNHTLNVSSVVGKSLSIADDENTDLYYIYSPCSNTMKCDNKYAMSYLLDVSTFECKKYLAIWEDGIIEPNYSQELKSWQFVYTNGESCDGFENIFIVEWICDNTAKTPKIIEAKQTMTCNYQLRINSTLACG